jgi:hypothetical protein
MRQWVGFDRLVGLVLGGALATTLGSVCGRANAASTVTRTLSYHQITLLTAPVIRNDIGYPVLSDSGNRAVFATPGDAGKPSPIFVINADGTGVQRVDPGYSTSYQLDISADGSKAVSTNGRQVNIANADGSGARSLIVLDDGDINALRISGDGTKVFFRMARGAGIPGSSPPQRLERGVWVINADGSGLRQIVGPTQMAPVLGVAAADVSQFASNGPGLDVSMDGSHIVFGMLVKPESAGFGQGLFGVDLSGGTPRDFLGRVGFVTGPLSLTSDGSKLGYHVSFTDSTEEVGVLDFDRPGLANRHKLADNDALNPLRYRLPASDDPLQLSGDGTKLLLGSSGLLLDTATGVVLQLSAIGGSYSSDPGPLAAGTLLRATMDSAATRFLYVAQPTLFGEVEQLATLELNSTNLGEAPRITGATIDPTFVLSKGRSSATVSASVSAPLSLVRVSIAFFQNGLQDPNVYPNVLLDDGLNGDARVSDGIFTLNVVAGYDAVVGPRTARVKAEARSSDGRRHATAVDIEPFEVRG